MGIPLVEALRAAKQNQELAELVAARGRLLQERCRAETQAQALTRAAAWDDVLVPFRDTFAKIRNVDLVELDEFDEIPIGELPDPRLRAVRLAAATSLTALVGGAVTGAAVGAGTYAAVGALAAASTGTAISALSGAAATSATLAWLGGGAVAAGGGGVAVGGAVLSGIVAAPVLLVLTGFLDQQGRRMRREQHEMAVALDAAVVQTGLTEVRTWAVLERGRQVRDLVTEVTTALGKRLGPLADLVAHDSDHCSYSQEQRRSVADTVALVTTLVAVLGCRFVDDDGGLTELSGLVLRDAAGRLGSLASR